MLRSIKYLIELVWIVITETCLYRTMKNFEHYGKKQKKPE